MGESCNLKSLDNDIANFFQGFEISDLTQLGHISNQLLQGHMTIEGYNVIEHRP